jgi:hypothetical protein
MKIQIGMLIVLFLFSLLLAGCIPPETGTKEEMTVKDSLALLGTCIITGKVLDNNTNEPIRGVNVVLFSRPKGVVTDLYGQYQIIDIEPGIYTLEVFCVGYTKKIIPDINAKSDRLIKLDIRLEPRVVQTDQ